MKYNQKMAVSGRELLKLLQRYIKTYMLISHNLQLGKKKVGYASWLARRQRVIEAYYHDKKLNLRGALAVSRLSISGARVLINGQFIKSPWQFISRRHDNNPREQLNQNISLCGCSLDKYALFGASIVSNLLVNDRENEYTPESWFNHHCSTLYIMNSV